ncbi:MAG: hypothetical protein NTW86_17325 [Candidatus Sumerlaeota bacterium]|nr:hypothetical protein [Candidatus Sumerlaeota bacterium]
MTVPLSKARCMARRWRAVACLGLFCGSFLLISYKDYGKGVFYYDEGYNLLEARFVYQAAERVASYSLLRAREGGAAPSFRDYIKERGKPGGLYPFFGKPLHTLILAAGLALSGGRAWGPSAVMALLSAGVVVLTFLLGCKLGGSRLGFAAALLLGGSAYFLNYARLALAEMDSAFFYMLAALVYLPAAFSRSLTTPTRRLFSAGLLAGLAFAANYRWFWIPLVFAAMEAQRGWAMRGHTTSKSAAVTHGARMGVLLGGFLLVLLIFEIPYAAAAVYFKRVGLTLPFMTYFQQVFHMYFLQPTSRKSFDWAGVQTYVYLLWKLQHGLVVAFLIVGLLTCLRRGRAPGRVWLCLNTLAPLVFYSFYTFRFARFLSLSLPFLALMEARGLAYVCGRPGRARLGRKWRRSAWLIALVALLAVELWTARAIFSLTSPYAAVQRDLAQLGETKYLSTEVFISRWEAGNANVEFPPKSWEELRELAGKGYHYVMIGPLARYWGPMESLEWLEKTEAPVKTYPNPSGGYFLYRFEHNRDFHKTLAGVGFERPGTVRLYRLPF